MTQLWKTLSGCTTIFSSNIHFNGGGVSTFLKIQILNRDLTEMPSGDATLTSPTLSTLSLLSRRSRVNNVVLNTGSTSWP
jgi:hypothetical protein